MRILDAVRELERHNAEAARWWQENAPDVIQPGKLMAFPGEAFQLVEDFEA